MLYLTINNDRVQISRGHDDAFPYTLKSVADFRQYLRHESLHGPARDDLPVYRSSSIDFPEEFTTNPATIALAKELSK